MSFSLRLADADDMAEVGAMHYRSRVAAYRDFLPARAIDALAPEALSAWWTERFAYERDSHRLTVAVADGRLVGFTYVGPDEDHGEGVGELYAIHLEPDAQGRGVGRALMIDALISLTEGGFSAAVLWVLEGNVHARRFYERGGWALDGREREEKIGGMKTRQLRYAKPLG